MCVLLKSIGVQINLYIFLFWQCNNTKQMHSLKGYYRGKLLQKRQELDQSNEWSDIAISGLNDAK